MVESRIIFSYERPCKWCGELFFSKDRRRVYCSTKCANNSVKKYMRERYRKIKNGKPIYCKNCGKLITRKFRRIFCSDDCYHDFYQ